MKNQERTKEDLEKEIAELAAANTALRAEVEQTRQAQTLSLALNSISGLVHSTVDFDSMMQCAMTEAAKALGSDTAAISLREGDHWVPAYVHGFPADVIGVRMSDEEEPHALLAVTSRKPVAIDDAFNDDRVNREHMKKWNVRAVLVTPLLTKERVVGVVFFNFHHAPFAFQPAHLDFATKLAAGVSLALDNAEKARLAQRESADRTRAEEVLRESQELFHVAQELSPNGFTILRPLRDPSGNIIDFEWVYENDAVARLNNTDPEEVLGRRVSEFSPTHASTPFYELYKRVIETGTPDSIEAEYKTERMPNSSWIRVAAVPINGDIAILGQNITRHKRAEEALRISEHRERERAEELAAMLEAVPTPVIIVHNSDGTHMTGNRAADELLRQPRGAEISLSAPPEVRSGHFKAIKDGRELRIDELPARRAARGENVQDFEYSLVFDDGTARHLLAYGTPLWDDKGQPRGAVHTLVDITERKAAEEAVQRTLQRLYTVLSSMYGGLLLVSDESRVEFANQALCDYLDLNDSPADLVGLTSSDIFAKISKAYLHPDEAIACIREIVDRGQPVKGEQVAMRSGRELLRDFIPIRIGGQSYGRLWCHTDVTERKAMERALQKARDDLEQRVIERTEELANSEREFRLLAEAMPQIVWITRADGWNIYFNQQWVDYTGLTLEESYGHGWNKPFHPDDQQRAWDAWQNAVTNNGTYSLECRLRKADGTYRWWLIRGVPVIDEKGTISKWFGTCTDIWEIKRVEAQLRQAQKMEALGTMGGGIAHDFNNILAAIIGFSELLEGNVAKGSREARHLHRVLEAGIRGRELVKQMLTFSRKAEQEKKPLLMSSIVKETIKLLRATTPSTIGIKVNASNEALILGDPTQIQQVLMNLCTNATHAMQEKGGSLDIELSELSVSPSKGNPHGIDPGLYVKLAVRDTGTGIPADIMDKIFDPFFTTKKVGEGTGLGLSVVHGIVKQHDGYITVESETGRGSTFTVYFPRITGGPEADALHGDEIPTGSERILFVDDEEALVEMGEDILAELGYEVTSRMSSREALALLKSDPSRFDLVITDQTMPEMTGVELAKEVLAIRADMPIIMCTGFSYVVDADKARAAGIKAFAMKPLTKREIAKTIRKVLDEISLV
ncbi:MAG: PAS domain-containing protein [Syntrophorhabdales bacterium]